MSAAEVPLGPPPAPVEPPPISPFAALAGTFGAPGKTFERLAKKPTWWLPFVLFLLVAILAPLVTTPKIDLERSIRETRFGAQMSDEQLQKAVEGSHKPPLRTAITTVIFTTAIFFLIALLLWGGAKAFGSEARFLQVTAVYGHALLPFIAGSLLSLPVIASLPDESMTQVALGNAFKSHVGAFLPEGTPMFLSSVASSLDVFSLYALVLLAVGMRKLPEMPKGAGVAVPVTLWAIYVLGKSALLAFLFP